MIWSKYNFIKGKEKIEKNVEIKCQEKWRMKKLSTKHVDINGRRSLTCRPNALAGGNFFGSLLSSFYYDYYYYDRRRTIRDGGGIASM